MRPIDRRTRLRSSGAALTFVIAAIAGVAGGKLSGKITLAWALFAGLVTAGMLLTYWLDRESGKNELRMGRPDDGKPAGADLRKAQGVQVGDHNVQNNKYFNHKTDD